MPGAVRGGETCELTPRPDRPTVDDMTLSSDLLEWWLDYPTEDLCFGPTDPGTWYRGCTLQLYPSK